MELKIRSKGNVIGCKSADALNLSLSGSMIPSTGPVLLKILVSLAFSLCVLSVYPSYAVSKSEARDTLRKQHFLDYEDEQGYLNALGERNVGAIKLFFDAWGEVPFNSLKDSYRLEKLLYLEDPDIYTMILSNERDFKYDVNFSSPFQQIVDWTLKSVSPLSSNFEPTDKKRCSNKFLSILLRYKDKIDPSTLSPQIFSSISSSCLESHQAIVEAFSKNGFWLGQIVYNIWQSRFLEKSSVGEQTFEKIYALKSLTNLVKRELGGFGDLGMYLIMGEDGAIPVYFYGPNASFLRSQNIKRITKINGIECCIQVIKGQEDSVKVTSFKQDNPIIITVVNDDKTTREITVTPQKITKRILKKVQEVAQEIDSKWFSSEVQDSYIKLTSVYDPIIKAKCDSEKEDLKILKSCAESPGVNRVIMVHLDIYRKAFNDLQPLIKEREEKERKRPKDQKIFDELCSLAQDLKNSEMTRIIAENAPSPTLGDLASHRNLAATASFATGSFKKEFNKKSAEYKKIVNKNPDLSKCEFEDEEEED